MCLSLSPGDLLKFKVSNLQQLQNVGLLNPCEVCSCSIGTSNLVRLSFIQHSAMKSSIFSIIVFAHSRSAKSIAWNPES